METGGNCCSIKSTPLKPIKMKLVENCPLTSTDGNTRTVEIRNPTRNKLLNSLQLIFFFSKLAINSINKNGIHRLFLSQVFCLVFHEMCEMGHKKNVNKKELNPIALKFEI